MSHVPQGSQQESAGPSSEFKSSVNDVTNAYHELPLPPATSEARCAMPSYTHTHTYMHTYMHIITYIHTATAAANGMCEKLLVPHTSIHTCIHTCDLFDMA